MAIAGGGLPERLGGRRRDFLEQRCGDQERPVVGMQLLDDLRGQVAVERVGLASQPGDVVLGAPRLEEHAGDPAAGGLHRRDRVDLRPPEVGQRPRCLAGGEGQVSLADGRHAAERRRGPGVDDQLAPTHEHDAHGRRCVADDGPEHRQRIRGVGQALELVDDQQQWGRADRLGQQTGGLGVRYAPCRRGADAVDMRRVAHEGGLQVGDEPPGRGIGRVEREPGHGLVDVAPGLHDRRRLAGAGRRCDPHDAIAVDQHRQQALQTRAPEHTLAHCRDREFALDDRSVAGCHRPSSLRQSRGAEDPEYSVQVPAAIDRPPPRSSSLLRMTCLQRASRYCNRSTTCSPSRPTGAASRRGAHEIPERRYSGGGRMVEPVRALAGAGGGHLEPRPRAAR